MPTRSQTRSKASKPVQMLTSLTKYWRARINPAFGSSRLDEIDRAAVREWVAELQAAGLAPSTIHMAAQILSMCLRAAVDDGRLARNPADRIDLPRIEREEMRFLTPHQAAELSDAIDPAYRALVLLGAYGGLRLGEMLALRRDRVDLLHRQVDVAETVATVRGKLVVNPPKTRAGHRRVPLPRVATDALQAHLEAAPASDLVFTAPEGGYVRAELWRRRVWTPAVRATALEPLRPHDLRHTVVAFWIAAGASPKEIATRAGHASVVTVLDRYGHLLPGMEDRVTDALDALAESVSRDGRGMEAVAPFALPDAYAL
jgi:integrase